jgi:hypothetical protein
MSKCGITNDNIFNRECHLWRDRKLLIIMKQTIYTLGPSSKKGYRFQQTNLKNETAQLSTRLSTVGI